MTVTDNEDSLHGFMVTPDPYGWLPDSLDEREVPYKLPEGLHVQASDLRARRSVNPRADGITGLHAAVAGGRSSVGNELLCCRAALQMAVGDVLNKRSSPALKESQLTGTTDGREGREGGWWVVVLGWARYTWNQELMTGE